MEIKPIPKIAKQFTKGSLINKIKNLIVEEYGKDHSIKTALFKSSCEYNDSTYDYDSPQLILIDKNADEIIHPIDVSHLVPNDSEQREWRNWLTENKQSSHDENWTVGDITIKF